MPPQSITILGCRVDAVGRAEAVERVLDLASGATPSLVVTLGTEMVVRARRDGRFADVVNASALSLCDTVGLLLTSRLRGGPLRERVAGVELVDDICRAAAERQIAVFLLGAKPPVVRAAAERLLARHPRLIVAGVRDGYFGSESDAQVAASVRASGARILFAGLGSPRQEFWLAGHLDETGCGVGIGVGGSFDVISGTVERAPHRWRALGLEWLYRLVKEPHRWRRQLALPQYALLALGETVSSKLQRRLHGA